jgi:hypothetical protein
MDPCWSCGAQDRACYQDCNCAKCRDPEGYEKWKEDNPERYGYWLRSHGSESD